jgi:hypothetical protein
VLGIGISYRLGGLGDGPRRLISSLSTEDCISFADGVQGAAGKVSDPAVTDFDSMLTGQRRSHAKEFATELREKLTIQQILIDDVTNVG